MLMERGKMIEIGEPAGIALSYRRINFGRLVHEVEEESRVAAPVASPAEILSAWFEDPEGERIMSASHGDPCIACFEVRFNEPVRSPVFGVTLRNDARATVFATTTAFSQTETGDFEAGRTAVVRMRFENWLTASRYTLSPSVARAGAGEDVFDVQEDIAALLVHGWHFTGGVTNLPHVFEVDSR
jgi:hypothetical protein